MFGGDDEDGDFLSPTGGAKLASLFGLDQAANQGNESFQYTAPKQPRKTSNPAPPGQKPAAPPGAPAVLLATAVQAFRYINGQYVKQGKLGAAVLGSHTAKEYKLLLYVSQQKQVASAKIHAGFVFTVQPNNYGTFYDDQRQNWSLMFETEKASVDFGKEVCLAKVNSAASVEAVVVQDLTLGEGEGAEHGDSLEVAYTGWLLQNHAFGQVFDTNLNKDKLLRLKLGAGKVIKGWEEGMLGMKKAGRRLMVIPPGLGYGSKGVPNRIPADSTLIFEAELRRVKFARDSGSDRASASSKDSAAPSPAPSPAPSVENLSPENPTQPSGSGPGRPGEPPLRTKSNSLSEQLTNPDATKAKLISRMAKMGQPMLPFLAGAASQPDSSDSEMEDPGASRVKDRPAVPSPVQISTAPPGSAQVLSHPHAAPPSALLPVAMATAATHPGIPGATHAFQPYPYTQTSIAPSQLQPVGQMYPAQTGTYMGSGDVTSFLMTEARQHNTEIRLAIGKVADKVDQLNSKVDDIQRQGNLSMAMPNMSMETSMIMHNIQRIVQENECLKKEVFEKSSRVEEQNHKIGELINQNQRYMEQSHLLLEQRNDSLKSCSEQNQARVLQAEQDKVRLTEELASSTARVAQLQQEATAHQQRASELQGQLASALREAEANHTHVTALEGQLEELKETVERTQAQYRSEKQKRKEMELRVSIVEEEAQDLKADKESLERALSDRKRKWLDERWNRDEEMEELRRSSQRDLDALRAQLRKARTSTDQAASQQLSQLQAELEVEWRGKCEQALGCAKEQHGREVAELAEQRDALEQKLLQTQEKFTALKQSRDSGEHGLLQQQGEKEELQALQEKYASLERQSVATRERLEGQVAELEGKVTELEQGQGNTTGEVKRVMNGVFHSLRGEFDLNESYSGSAVLGVIVMTIKNVTLRLLSGAQNPPLQNIKNDQVQKEEVAEKEEKIASDTKAGEERPPEMVHINGTKEEESAESAEPPPHIGTSEEMESGDTRQEVQQEVARDKEVSADVNDCSTPSQSEPAEVTAPQPTCSELQNAVATDNQSGPEKEVQDFTATSTEPAGECIAGPSPPTDLQPNKQAPSRTEATVPPENATIQSECAAAPIDNVGPLEEKPVMSNTRTGPPLQPPPPPNLTQDSKITSLTEGVEGENGEEPFFQSTAPTKPPPPPTDEEDDDEELSLKGRPPPAPLFGEDEDEDDLDWLS